jgi:hypothetical protein
MTAIYLVPYHSEPGLHLDGSAGQFELVEKAILAGEWPYDNGDDPSFYVARLGGPLTWGVCRQDLRNAIGRSSIVVFFSYTSRGGIIRYRLTAVATVADTVNRRDVFDDPRFRKHRDFYLNILIKPTKDGWKYDESDRACDARHDDWLWRIAVHDRHKKPFWTRNQKIYETGQFKDGDVPLAQNYIVFSTGADETFISPDPPEVAVAVKGRHEKWNDNELRHLTVEKAGTILKGGRNYLRIVNSSGRNVHRQIRFNLPSKEASTWRQSLISALKLRHDAPVFSQANLKYRA